MHLNWGELSYCDSINLQSNVWYHFAFSMSENPSTLYCYLNGDKLSVGTTPISAITNNIVALKEITFGGSIGKLTSESRFNGYVKDFRWWKRVRS